MNLFFVLSQVNINVLRYLLRNYIMFLCPEYHRTFYWSTEPVTNVILLFNKVIGMLDFNVSRFLFKKFHVIFRNKN